jgi:hypothetical protein
MQFGLISGIKTCSGKIQFEREIIDVVYVRSSYI